MAELESRWRDDRERWRGWDDDLRRVEGAEYRRGDDRDAGGYRPDYGPSGYITLSGAVNGRLAKRRSEDLADQVSGVRHVQNNLRVRPQPA